jgi:UDP-glucose 4-epimerase
MNPPVTPSPSSYLLVTGGAGFIGSHLVERLISEGNRVIVIDDLSTGSLANLAAVQSHPRFHFIHAKVSACPDLEKWVAGASGIYHLAAAVGVELVVNSPIRTLQTNLRETEILLEAAAAANTPVLVASTSEVYGKSQKDAFSETDDLLIGPPHQSRWSYACSKLMDEFLALAYWQERKLPVVIVRLFNTVGPRQTGRYGMVLPRFITAARRNEPLRVYGDGLQSRCFCFVGDTVEALLRLQRTEDSRGRVFNIGGTEEVTVLELARRVIAQVESSSTIEFVPYAEAYAPGFDDMRRRKPVLDRLEATTGFKPATPLSEIIRRTAAG